MISVIIPTSGDPVRLPMTLAALKLQRHRDFEVIVVNDGGPSAQSLVPEPFRWHYLPNPEGTFWPGRARNHGVRYSRGEMLVFLDEDCVVGPFFLARMARTISQGVIVFAPRHYLDEKDIGPYESFTELLKRCQPPHGPYASSHAMGVEAQMFCDIGGFDESYVGWGFEDVDLVSRLRLAQHYIDGQVVHLDHPPRSREGLADRKKKFYEGRKGPDRLRNGGCLIRLLNLPLV